MNPFKRGARVMHMAFCIVIVLGIVFSAVFYNQRMRMQSVENAVGLLSSSAGQEARVTRMSIESRYNVLGICAGLYVDMRDQNAGDMRILRRLEQITSGSGFEQLGIILPDGTTYTSMNTIIDLGEMDFAKKAFSGKNTMATVYDSRFGDKKYFVFAVPAMRGDVMAGVVYGLCGEAGLKELIDPSTLGYSGISAICRSDGELVFSSSDGIYIRQQGGAVEIENIFQLLVHSNFSGVKMADISADLAAGNSGAASFTRAGRVYYMVYQPVGMDGWMVINLLSEKQIEYTADYTARDVLAMILTAFVFTGMATIVLIFVGFHTAAAIRKSRDLLEKSEENARQQRGKLSFALEHSSTLVWEYIVATRSVVREQNGIEVTIDGAPERMVADGTIHPDDAEEFLAIYDRIAAGEQYISAQIRVRERNDEIYGWHSIEYTTVFGDDGKPQRAVGVSNDISAQKSAEQRYENELAYRRLADPSTLISFCVNLTRDAVEDCICYDSAFGPIANVAAPNELSGFLSRIIPNPRERERFRTFSTTDYMLKLYDRGEYTYHLDYRCTLGESIKWVSMAINLIKSPVNDDILAFIYVKDVTYSRLLELTMQNSVMADYEYMACLDMKSDRVYSICGDNKGYSQNTVREESFPERLDRLAKNELHISDSQKEELSSKSIKAHLSNADSYTHYFEVPLGNGETARKKAHYIMLDRDEELVLLNRVDVTDVYREEMQKNAMLTKALAEAEKASRARGDFLAHMSHEIRTPLNGIRGMLDIIKEDPGENLSLYLDKAIISAKHLTGLINDILDMSKIDSGKMELAEVWFPVGDFVEYIEAIISPLAAEKGLHFCSHFTWNDCGSLYTDEGRLKQICINLLSNAVKYTDRGGTVEFFVSTELTGGDVARLNVCVKDNGIGMSEEFLSHAFEPFTQAEKSFGVKGTGLGLSITKSLIDLMRGHMTVKSAIGQGTEIGFESKVRTRPAPSGEGAPDTSSYMFMSRRALVVDDHDINRMITEKQLVSFGLEVTTATDGKQAVERFAASPEYYFDIILMDIMMPVMDGLEASRMIRAMKRDDAKSIEIVAMTANAFAEDIHKSLENGMNYHLAKPFDRQQLLSLLRRIFDERGAADDKTNSGE